MQSKFPGHVAANIQYGPVAESLIGYLHARHYMPYKRMKEFFSDAFNLPDFLLNSPFGRYDGDVYTHYFAHVRAQNPPVHPPPYFDKLIKPLLFREEEDQGEPEEEE